MNHFSRWVGKQIKRLIAVSLVVGLFVLTRLPSVSAQERASLASRFDFQTYSLPELGGYTPQFERKVHPSLKRHSAWTSVVGAAVALNDLDQDGLPNDICYVDTRINQVVIAPVPGSPNRYPAFALDVGSLPYEQSTMAPMGCLMNDLNEDGKTDVLTYYWGRTPVIHLRQGANNERSGLSETLFTSHELVTTGERWFTNAATLSDLDGDGHTDIVLGNYHPDGSRILETEGPGMEPMQHSMSRAYNGGSSRFFLWAGASSGQEANVEFREAQGVLDDKLSHGWTLAVGTADLDGDLLPEVYFANDFGPDHLLHNRSKPGVLNFALVEGKRQLTTPRSKVLGRDSFKGMGVDFGDVNQDGLLDIYVSNIAAEYALEESHFLYTSTGHPEFLKRGVAPYVDRSEPLGLSRSGWAWEAKFGDFDNDGTLEAMQATGFEKGTVNRWPELQEMAMGNDELLSDSRFWPRFQGDDELSGYQHNPFFVQDHNGRYIDIAKELGIDSTEVSRGIATADVDGDGDLDFAIANQWEPSYFYENTAAQPGTFLGLHVMRDLNSVASSETVTEMGHLNHHEFSQPAIGASATVHLPDGRQLVAQVDGGNGHSGARSSDLHFGLGQLPPEQPLRVDLHWRNRDGKVASHTFDLKPGWHTVLLSRSQEQGV